jgi:hypothetical protein
VADVTEGSIASWVQTGGVGLFAAAVFWQLQQLKPILKQVGETLAALLERERMRAERTRQGGEVSENWDSPTTGPIVEVRTPARAKTATPRGGVSIGGGYSIKRPGGG